MSSRCWLPRCGVAISSSWTGSVRTKLPASARQSRLPARLLYLPPYSPDLNPIEQAFAKLKALLRARALRTVAALWNALGDLVSCFAPAECANFLRHAGYF